MMWCGLGSEWVELDMIMIERQCTDTYSCISLCTPCDSSLVLGGSGVAVV